jgi:hypothetical protein
LDERSVPVKARGKIGMKRSWDDVAGKQVTGRRVRVETFRDVYRQTDYYFLT